MEQSLLIDEVCCAWKIKLVKRDIDASAPRGVLGRRRTKSRPNSQSSVRCADIIVFSTHFLHSHDLFNRKGSTTLRLQAMKITQLSMIFTTQKFLYIQEISTPVSRV